MILIMNSNELFHSFPKYFIINVERIGLMTYLRVVWCCSCMTNSNRSPRSIMSLLNIETHLVLRYKRSPRSVWKTEFFVKNEHRSPENGTCFFHLACQPGRPALSRIGFGWVARKIFACRATSPCGCRATFEPNSLFHSCFSEIFGGGRGDIKTFSYMTSSVSILTTLGIQ